MPQSNEEIKGEVIFLSGYFKGKGWPVAHRAVTLAKKWHDGHIRDDGSLYLGHLTTCCRMLLNLNNPIIVTEAKAAAMLVHDSVEEGKATLEVVKRELGSEVHHHVDDMTYRKGQEQKEQYFARLAQDPGSLLLKGPDRIFNLGGMIVLTRQTGDLKRLREYVESTKYLLFWLKEGRRLYQEYSDAFVLYRDHLNSLIAAANAYLEEAEQRKQLEERVEELKKELEEKVMA